jgi:hypothetical protein
MSTPLPVWLPEQEPPEGTRVGGAAGAPPRARSSPGLVQLAELAAGFPPLSLADLGAASLMERVDSKFLLPAPSVPQLLGALAGEYRVLQVGGVRLARYSTRYFDTPDLALYRAHQAGRLPRHKVRVRSYLDSGERYLEVKLKNNKGRTLKTRTPLGPGEATLERVRREALLRTSGSVPGMELEEILTAEFTRLTLVREDAPERLTVDVGLTYTRGDEVRELPGVAVAEIKQDRPGQADARDALRSLYLRDGSVSKYCIGVALLVPDVKKNRFKRVLSALARIEREHASS